MSNRVFEVEGSSPSVGAVFARVLEGRADFKLGEGATLEGVRVVGVRVPRALDAEGHQRQDLFGFYLKNPAEARRFRNGERVILKTAEDAPPGETADALTVLEEALSELRMLSILLWHSQRADFLTALGDEKDWLPKLGRDPATVQDAILAIREIRNAVVHGIEPAAKQAGYQNLDEYFRLRMAPELKSLRQLRYTLERAA